MPPIVALYLCVALIFMLCRFDPAKKTVSFWLWVPTIWFMIMGSRMVSEWFSGSDSFQSVDAYSEGSPLDRAIFFALIAGAILILIKRRLNVTRLVSGNVWLTLFLVYSGMSIAWSDFPFVAFKRYIKDVGDLLMVAVVLTESDKKEAIATLLKRCAYTLIPLSIVLYKYYPGLGRGYGVWLGELFVVGVTNNKNSLGVLSLVCGMGVMWRMLPAPSGAWRPTWRTVLASGLALSMTLWTLIASRSATSLACFVAGTAVLVAAPILRRSASLAIACVLLGVGALIAAEVLMGGVVNAAINGLGRDTTLTGRTDVWNDVFALNTNPLFGVGFGSFWLGDRMASLWRVYHWQPTEAHNGYLEIYVELGVVGLVLLTGLLVSTFYSTLRAFARNVDFERLRLSLLVITLLYNVTESAFRVDLLMYCVFLLMSVDIPSSEEAVASARPSAVRTAPVKTAAAGRPAAASRFPTPAAARREPITRAFRLSWTWCEQSDNATA